MLDKASFFCSRLHLMSLKSNSCMNEKEYINKDINNENKKVAFI